MATTKEIIEAKKKLDASEFETDLQRVERKVDELNANVIKMIESMRIFKLNFQQTSMMRK